MVTTERLNLIPATVELSRAEMTDHARFSELLGAEVPDNWPPESTADVLDLFLDLLLENPDWLGWLAWYAVERRPGVERPVLVGGAGFKGAPDAEGRVETGYSVLPQFQRRGIATEMVEGLVGWAGKTGRVRQVLAQTTDDNSGSRGVLARLGFEPCGPGTDAGHTMYALSVPSADDV